MDALPSGENDSVPKRRGETMMPVRSTIVGRAALASAIAIAAASSPARTQTPLLRVRPVIIGLGVDTIDTYTGDRDKPVKKGDYYVSSITRDANRWVVEEEWFDSTGRSTTRARCSRSSICPCSARSRTSTGRPEEWPPNRSRIAERQAR